MIQVAKTSNQTDEKHCINAKLIAIIQSLGIFF